MFKIDDEIKHKLEAERDFWREQAMRLRDALFYYTGEDLWYDSGVKPWKHGFDGYEIAHFKAVEAIADFDQTVAEREGK